MGSAATERNRHSSRHCKHIQLHYHPQNENLLGAKGFVYLAEGQVFSPGKSAASNTKGDQYVNYSLPYIFSLFLASLNSIKNVEEFKINNTQKEPYLIAAALAYTKDFDLVRDFSYIRSVILESGCISEAIWHSWLGVIAACIHLLSVSIVGSESTIISSATKSSVAMAEVLLGLPPGSITNILLKKKADIDRPLNNSNSEATVDCKPAESRQLLETICSIVFSRCFESLLKICSFDDSAGKTRVVHVVDSPGWEILSVDSATDSLICGNLHQLLLNYVEERLHHNIYLQSVFMEEIKSFNLEGVDITSELQCKIPNCGEWVEFFEKPVGGIFSLFEDVSLSPVKLDEKAFCEKILTAYSVSSSSKGTQAMVAPLTGAGQGKGSIKATVFVVRHTFGDICYDLEGFVMQNKTHSILANHNRINTLLAASSVQLIATAPSVSPSSSSINNAPKPPEAKQPPVPPPPGQLPSQVTKSAAVKVDRAAMAAQLLLCKVKNSMVNFVQSLQESVPFDNQFFCLCISPSPYLVCNAF